MEQEEGFIVGIDLGSSSIIGLVGRKNDHEVVSILASESVPSDSCINHGIIYNIDDAAGKVKQLIQKLENKTGRKIGKAYIALSGMSLKSVEDIEVKNFGVETTLTYAMLEQLKRQAKEKRLPYLSVYSSLLSGMYLDSKPEQDPIEKTATTVEVRYQLIAGRPDIKNKLQKCFEKNRIDIAGFITGAVASGTALLDKEEINAGCALVDFGGGTTTLSVYKDGFLRYLTTIPLGGKAITKDIQALEFSEKDAEDFKIRYGRVGKKTGSEQPAADSAIKNLREFNRIIQLRQEEIVLNIIRRLEESGYADQLGAGIFITGGASQLTGLPEFLEERAKIKVQTTGIRRIYTNNATIQDPSYSQCFGLILMGKEDCEKIEKPVVEQQPIVEPEPIREIKQPEAELKPVKPPKPPKDPIWKKFGRLFDDEQ